MYLRVLLQVDFSGGKTGHRSKHQQGKTEQVVKAAALPKRRAAASALAAAAATKESRRPFPSRQSPGSCLPLTNDDDIDQNDEVATPLPLLWDLTAGLGTDSFLLAQAGWRVEMFERSPVVASLVQVRIVCRCIVLVLLRGGGRGGVGTEQALLNRLHARKVHVRCVTGSGLRE